MKLSKRIPARTVTQTLRSVHKDWQPMTPAFRALRAGSGVSLERCDWCGHRFEDGEQMSLAMRPRGRNWVLCNDCADRALSTNGELT